MLVQENSMGGRVQYSILTYSPPNDYNVSKLLLLIKDLILIVIIAQQPISTIVMAHLESITLVPKINRL